VKTVLVVDDELDLLEIVKSHLEYYRVLTASSGKEGLEIAAREKPQLIILDIGMPHMDGFEMLHQLREIEALKKTPVLMLTAQGQSRNIFEAERLGAMDFVIKPFTREQLLESVRFAIN
jgi:DNA-binding response OmpR family regulator